MIHFYLCIFDTVHITFQTFLEVNYHDIYVISERTFLSLLLSSKVSFMTAKTSRMFPSGSDISIVSSQACRLSLITQNPLLFPFAFHKWLLSHRCPFLLQMKTENVEYNLQMPIISFVENNCEMAFSFTVMIFLLGLNLFVFPSEPPLHFTYQPSDLLEKNHLWIFNFS